MAYTSIPEGYHVRYAEPNGDLIVAAGFSQIAREAPAKIMYEGHQYTRGVIEPLTTRDSIHFCSLRRYVK